MSGLHPHKNPFKVLRTWNAPTREDGPAIRHVEYEADFWEGPGTHDDPATQGYRTSRATINAESPRNTCAPNVSFWPQLRKALGLSE